MERGLGGGGDSCALTVWQTRACVAAFVLGNAGATVAVAMFGARALPVTAACVIGLTMIVRDALHDTWHGRALAWRMLAMIVAGGVVAFAVNRDAAVIARASAVAFIVAEACDALMYHRLRRHTWFRRTNGSNALSALVDSLVFPTLAFGVVSPHLVVSQFVGKFAGGVVWSVVIARFRARRSRP